MWRILNYSANPNGSNSICTVMNHSNFPKSSLLLLFTLLLQLLYAIQIVLLHTTECFGSVFFVFCFFTTPCYSFIHLLYHLPFIYKDICALQPSIIHFVPLLGCHDLTKSIASSNLFLGILFLLFTANLS